MGLELDVRYVKSDDGLHIAYACLGQGPPDVVYLGGAVVNLRSLQEPLLERYRAVLSSFCRLVAIDDRGTGLSDPVALSELPSLEVRMDDLPRGSPRPRSDDCRLRPRRVRRTSTTGPAGPTPASSACQAL